MPERKRKLSLVEILVILAILWIMISIFGGARQKQKARQAAGRPPASSQAPKPAAGQDFFWRP